MKLVISAWITIVQANIVINCFEHGKIRFINNVASENLNQHNGGIQQLYFLIK